MTAALWAERTPPNLVFHLKPHPLLTGQPSEVARLPEDVTGMLPAKLLEESRVYAKDLPLEVNDAIWERLLEALEPLRKAGKLGGVLLQHPRLFLPNPPNKDLIAESVTRLAAVGATVEFRNRMWFGSDRCREGPSTPDVSGTLTMNARASAIRGIVPRRRRSARARPTEPGYFLSGRVRRTITRSGSSAPSAGSVSVRPNGVWTNGTASPVRSIVARVTRAPTPGMASRRSRQSSTCTNTVSARCVVTPHERGGTGPPRVS